jgi:hypothetical protein
MRALMKLLDESGMRLIAVLALGVRLRPLLLGTLSVLGIADLFRALGGGLVLVIVLSIAHLRFLVAEDIVASEHACRRAIDVPVTLPSGQPAVQRR